MIELIKEDILNSDAKYIAHQCNCITTQGKGLSKSIFNKYPYSDIYSNRTRGVNIKNLPEDQTPGSIIIKGNGSNQRYVINMLGQIYPGKPKFPNNGIDSNLYRQRYFIQCLNEISSIDLLESIAFPYGIGCGLAGGNWDVYKNMLEEFSERIYPNKVFLYKID